MSKLKFMNALTSEERNQLRKRAKRQAAAGTVAGALLMTAGTFGFLHGVEIDVAISVQDMIDTQATGNHHGNSDEATAYAQDFMYSGGGAFALGLLMLGGSWTTQQLLAERRARQIVQRRIQPADVALHEAIR